MYIVGIDPGKTTGIAILRRTDFDPDANKWGIKVVLAGDISWEDRYDGIMPYLNAALQHLKRGIPTWIVYEQFRLRPNYTAVQEKAVPAVEATGILLHQLHMLGFPKSNIISQPAANRKSVRILPGHSKFMTSPHSKDAYRHARYFIVTQSNKEVKAIKERQAKEQQLKEQQQQTKGGGNEEQSGKPGEQGT